MTSLLLAGADRGCSPGPVSGHAATGDCWACHGDSWAAVKAPDHEGLGYPRDCSLCHRTSGWDAPGGEAHAPDGTFPLLGRHRDAGCAACHGDTFEPLDPACAACHRDEYDGTTSPPHASGGFPTTCRDCHGFEGWKPATGGGPHGPSDSFPLVGRHADRACADCHGTGPLGHLDPACAACHQDDYDATTAPDHGAAGYPKTCQDCHDVNGWKPAKGGPHGPSDSFPLVGKHADRACADCHGTGPLGHLDPACAACHQDDYDKTDNPTHATAGYPTTCKDCHGADGWEPAAVPQHAPGGVFPLAGGHAGRACSDCHQGPFADVPKQCWGCHEDDFASVRDPDHVLKGLPKTCDDCHTTASWSGASYDAFHVFPLKTGRHAGFACVKCHLAGRPWADYSCTHCHEHGQIRMDAKHAGEAGYAWESTKCVQCHPKGENAEDGL